MSYSTGEWRVWAETPFRHLHPDLIRVLPIDVGFSTLVFRLGCLLVGITPQRLSHIGEANNLVVALYKLGCLRSANLSSKPFRAPGEPLSTVNKEMVILVSAKESAVLTVTW